MTSKDKLYLLYDGDCGFCNFWVQWILSRDKKDRFLFVSLQSVLGQQFLRERNLDTTIFNTIYLWKPQAFYLQKSTAIIKIAQNIGGIYRLAALGYLIPLWIRDQFYHWISINRYRFNTKACRILTIEEQKKFVSFGKET